jgi:hypothetical protein
MRILLALTCLTYSVLISSVFAANFTKGEGRFQSQKEDSHDFVKKQLIHEGYKSIISKELDKMELNKEVFWQKYQEKLNEKFVEFETKLKDQLKITNQTSPKGRKDFSNKLRYKKLNYQRSFGSLNTAITHFVIKKISRSQKYPNSRYIRMEGSVNPTTLSKIYYKFVAGDKRSEYGSLFINIDYQLSNTTYTELGIENENEFSTVITDRWIDWLSKNKPANIANVQILNAENRVKFDEYQKLPSEKMLTMIPEVFVNSLLLDIEVKIVRKKFDKRKNEYEFLYEGSGYLKDLQTNKIAEVYNFNSELKKYHIKEGVNLANIIVNHVYRMALGAFPQIVNSMKNITNVSSVQRVVATDFSNMYKVMSLVDMIQNKGIKYSVKAHIEAIGKNRAEIVIYYDGKVSDLKRMLNALRSANKGISYDVIDTGNILSIKFNKIANSDKTVI